METQGWKVNATPEQIKSYERLVLRYEMEPKSVKRMICGDGCILLDFGFIVIGIETDGYAHS